MTLNEQIEQTVLRRRLRYIHQKQLANSHRLRSEYKDVCDINNTVSTLLALQNTTTSNREPLKYENKNH